jgi:hypothetical protein
MSESAVSFESLPPEYQRVIQLAQEQLKIKISPLQELVGGWSGAAPFRYRLIVRSSDDDVIYESETDHQTFVKIDNREMTKEQWIEASGAHFSRNY